MADLYTRFISSIVFPLQEYLKHHDTVSLRKAMELSQWWPAEKLEGLRIQRLRSFLVDVGLHVPYYQKIFSDCGFEPTDVTCLADLQKLPFLTKADIRSNSDALRASNAQRLARCNTGGSSGEPLVFYIGAKRVSHDVAAKWRATRWWDVDIGDREIVVWGSPIELGAQDRVRMLRDGLMRTELLSAFEMSESRVDEFIQRICARRPKMLFGYPSSISHIALHAERRGIRLDNLGVKVVFVTSERLYEHQRAVISRLFGCSVANGYGGRDAGFIAHQCPSGGMHITAEDIIVEIIDQAGVVQPPGVAGEIVVTHLATRDYPFIRYRTGDIGVLAPPDEACACGRGLPLLKEIQGRSTDFVIAMDGTVLHGLSLIYIIRDLAGVKSFKVIQESLTQTRVLLIPETGFEQGSIDVVIQGFRRRLGEAVNVQVELVETIPAEKSGKFRYIVSHVTPPESAATGTGQ